ncbi:MULTISPECIES: hypothetical protein [unclassified Pseudomonas]|jgi:hypothetical protein|uniref:hypothetical protein n=1 Tax=unclassified Pseudomonas TaxID=196821 RepID=UPI000EA84118|nr:MULTISPECIES: hypothetical protein [unclassified Pseudomonas]AYF89197.1 hypothetical protein D6Z43_19355 [Pseudomonas sp. DY-1]MDH4651875.1 hypothetical protein [Pseudomonas sp. BN606]MRK21688.1 hypothetical protein [Pseudomonas sp. JG-B]
MTHLDMSPMLRRALQADALASGAMGLLLTLAAGPLEELLGLPRALLLGAGIGLLPFALALGWLANRQALRRGWIWAVLAINAVWVIDSLSLLALGWVEPTLLGKVFVIGQAVAVAVLAELEFFGLRRCQGVAA